MSMMGLLLYCKHDGTRNIANVLDASDNGLVVQLPDCGKARCIPAFPGSGTELPPRTSGDELPCQPWPGHIVEHLPRELDLMGVSVGPLLPLAGGNGEITQRLAQVLGAHGLVELLNKRVGVEHPLQQVGVWAVAADRTVSHSQSPRVC